MNDRLDELNLPLPERRPLPPVVRDRVRHRVLGGLSRGPRSRLDRVRPPLAVAASVAVLIAGAAIVGQSVGGAGDDGPLTPPTAWSTPAPPPLDLAAANANLDRCWAALQTAGKTAAVPARAAWAPVFELPNRGRTVTVTRAGDKPLFCETTRTTVTVSDPNAQPAFAAGSGTAAMMISKDGAVGGVVDKSWASMVFLSAIPDGGSMSTDVTIAGGLWVAYTDLKTAPGTRFTVRRTVPGHPETAVVEPGGVSTAARPGEAAPGQSHPELDLPRSAEPLVQLTDRLDQPPDRTSAAGTFFTECADRADEVLIDPDAWAPTVLGGTAPHHTVLATLGDEAMACTTVSYRTSKTDPNPVVDGYQLYPQYQPIVRHNPLQFASGVPFGALSGETILGLVRDDVAGVELLAPGREPVQATVVNGAFTSTYEYESEIPRRPDFTVVLRTATGAEIHRGPLFG